MSNKKDYKAMWEGLGLDIKGHNGLLDVLAKGYEQVYLSQEGRPEGMAYYDFVVSEAHGLRIEELLAEKEKGNKVIGTFCVFVPEEIILALGAVGVGLCAGAEVGSEAAEAILPRNICALIKSFVGFELAGLCPYFRACDMVVGETTCDGKKKTYELLGDLKNVHVMEVPHSKGERDRELWRDEIVKFVQAAEQLTGKELTPERLAEAIRLVNDRRRAQLRLREARKASPTPISGRDALLVNQIAFYDNPARFTESLDKVCDEVEARVAAGVGVAGADAPRILVSGCPMALPNWKLPFLIETAGATVVGEESCVGERGFRELVDEGGRTIDEMIDRLADRYLKIDCACFTPNDERVEHVVEAARELRADGVVYYSLNFCTPYIVEAEKIDRALEAEGVPVLRVETDYSDGDSGQLGTRIGAFLEMIKAGRVAAVTRE